MKITNRFNLPDAFYNFARNDKYSRGKADISVTTLIDFTARPTDARQVQRPA
jgi:hypothetical protein